MAFPFFIRYLPEEGKIFEGTCVGTVLEKILRMSWMFLEARYVTRRAREVPGKFSGERRRCARGVKIWIKDLRCVWIDSGRGVKKRKEKDKKRLIQKQTKTKTTTWETTTIYVGKNTS